MVNLSYTNTQRRQKIYIKAYAILCLIVLISMGFYSYQKWQEYSLINTAVAKNKELITVLRDEVSDEKSVYEQNREGFLGMNKEIEEKLAYIFPATDDYTSLTRQMDLFEEELSTKTNPFSISNIEYSTVEKTESYSILPVRMSIESSSENFSKFLQLIENSGSLDDQIRFMDIQSIRLNFNDDDEDSEIIKFSVQINAYYQK